MRRLSERLGRVAPEAATFVLVAAVYWIHFAINGYGRFYHDAAEYWDLGRRFGSDGFSLLAYDDSSRGYALPLLNRGLQWIAEGIRLNDVTIVAIAGGLLAATLGVVVLPRLAGMLFSEARVSWGRVLGLNGLLFLFWRDHLGFPLSDFPALLAACVGVIGLLRGTVPGFLLAGIVFGLAANMRPAYLPAVLVVLVVAALPLLRRGALVGGACAAAFAAGIATVAAPQIAMNREHHETWSPAPADARDIAFVQLNGGLLAQRYETYVGPPDRYPRTKVFYRDPATGGLLDEQIEGYGEYARLAVSHPHRLAASYVLHAFNGLHVLYPTPYVRDLENTSRGLSVLQYTILFLAVLRLALPDARRALGRVRWLGVLVLVAPAITALPGAMEPRFFLPLHVLAYMLVCFGPRARCSVLGRGVLRQIAIVTAYAAFLVLWIVLTEATAAQIEHPLS
ncbi:MAG: hypothetical protein ACRDQT_01650 [Gaiellaceae bacterium]